MELIYGGVDWGEKEHQIELLDSQQQSVLVKRVKTAPKRLYALAVELVELADGHPEQIHVAIEDPTRPVVNILVGAGIRVFSVNPRQIDRLRQTYRLSGAKDDVNDAYVIANEMRIRPEIFHEVEPDSTIVAELREAVRAFIETGEDATQCQLRLRHHLNRYFPQMLQLDWSLSHRVMLDLVELIPSPAAVAHTSLEAVKKVLGRCRKHSAKEVLELLDGPGHVLNEGTARGAQARALQQSESLRRFIEHKDRWEARLEELLERLSQAQRAEQQDKEMPTDVEIALSLPGVGVRNAAGLFADGSQAIVERDRERLRRQSIAPVTRQTGDQKHQKRGAKPFVHRRYACSEHLAQTMFHMGDSAQRHSPHYRERYCGLRDKGHTHGRSCRQVADQMLGPLFAMLEARTLYDPTLHGATRRAHAKRKAAAQN